MFDFYGVIRHDIQAHWLEQSGLTRTGPYAEASDLLDAGIIDLTEYLRRYEAASGHSATSIKAAFDATPAVAGMDQLLRDIKLSHDLMIGLLSNADDAPRQYLADHGLVHLFDDIVLSSEVGVKKPQPDIYTLALARLGIRAHEAIFVDDNPHNTAAAEALGIRSVVFTDTASLMRQLGHVGIRLPDSRP